MKNLEYVEHTFPAYYNSDSKILILGSLPSKVSRERSFYYMHPSNRFWKVLSLVYKENIGDLVSSKKEFLKRHKIALWDVIESCYIAGSSDSSISNVTPTNLKWLLSKTKIEKIYVLGNTAYQYYQKYSYPKLGIDAILLPSTSSANASWSLEKLVDVYQVLKEE